jgi:hypothetical protein
VLTRNSVTLVVIMVLVCVTNHGLIYDSIEPSSINSAMGGSVGVVNIWHNNPLTFYSNPAIASFHEGLSWGIKSPPPPFKRMMYSNTEYYDVSLISYGYKGVGLLLPSFNRQGRMGESIDFGKLNVYDEDGNFQTSVHSYERGAVFGIAVNPLEMSRNYYNTPQVLDYFNLAIGFSRIDHKIHALDAGPIDRGSFSFKTTSYNLGVLAATNQSWKNYVNTEAVFGFALFNVFDDEYTLADTHLSYKYGHKSLGWALSATLPFDTYLSLNYPCFQELLSFRFMSANTKPHDSNSSQKGYGGEIGFLNTFYFRRGSYEDKTMALKGDTKGYGIRLNYNKMVSFSYNYSECPSIDDIERKEHEIAASFDILEFMAYSN